MSNKKCNIQEENLRKADLSKCNLENAILKGKNLRKANLRGANLTGADLENAILKRVHLSNNIFDRVNLRGVDFTEINNLRDINLQKRFLQGVDFSGGRAFEVHNVFSMIDLQKLQEFMDDFASTHNLNPKIIPDVISDTDDYIFLVFENFIKKAIHFQLVMIKEKHN